MFLRSTIRRKDGKEHRYWSVVEARRVAGGRVVQRPVLYLGEINSSHERAWRKSIEVLEEGSIRPRTLALFPEDRCEGVLPDASIVRLKLSELRLERPRQWGACWLALTLWQELQLDGFWGERLSASRKGTRWDLVLFVLVAYRLIAPGSEWRLHREWYAKSALMDLLGTDETLADIHALYRCHDRLLAHKEALFNHLVGRWRDLFNASFDVLLYDLTSTYFEANPPFPDDDKRRFGYSCDKRSDCVQVVIALIVTPEGLPLAYEVLPGNTADCTTLKGFLAAIERQYGKARRRCSESAPVISLVMALSPSAAANRRFGFQFKPEITPPPIPTNPGTAPPKVTDPEAPPLRPERHVAHSIATLRRRLKVGLLSTRPMQTSPRHRKS